MSFSYIEKYSKDKMRRAEISKDEHFYTLHLYTFADLGIVNNGGRMEGWCRRLVFERHYEIPTAFCSDSQVKTKMHAFLREGTLPNEAEILANWRRFAQANKKGDN